MPPELSSTLPPSHDTLVLTGGEVSGEPVNFEKNVALNGASISRNNFPQIRGVTRLKSLATARLADLKIRAARCAFCRTPMTRSEFELRDLVDDELPNYRSESSLSTCESCRHWEHVEFRNETYDSRGLMVDRYQIAITVAKTREFEQNAPDGSLEEIAQWFRRHPKLYNSVTPKYLEHLIARIFANNGEYCEVRHVGRPDDGGVDVVLIEASGSTWLVQVKRREHPESVEPVSTIRNLLGTLLLEESTRGIVVSTADHFSYRAQQAVDRIKDRGYIVRLVDRRALDQILASRLPLAPWQQIMERLDIERSTWFGTSASIEESRFSNPHQMTLF